MERINFIEALEDAATARGWKFDFAIDDRNQDFNIGVTQEFMPGDIILLVAVRMLPTFNGSSAVERKFTTLLMLGRKFEETGTVASLDETSRQKYDRRLYDLEGELESFISSFACDNELDVIPSEFSYAKNLFDTNIDFVITSNTQFIQ